MESPLLDSEKATLGRRNAKRMAPRNGKQRSNNFLLATTGNALAFTKKRKAWRVREAKLSAVHQKSERPEVRLAVCCSQREQGEQK